MSKTQQIVHIYPAEGGVARYAEVISKIYKQQGFEVVDVAIGTDDQVGDLVTKVAQYADAICHFEAGAGDSKVLAVARKTLQGSTHKQIMTIHDTGQFVRHPLDNQWAHSEVRPLRLVGKLARKALSVILGGFIRESYLASDKVVVVYLRQDLAEATGRAYLPQPVYTQGALSVRKATKTPQVIGYGGYWGQYKGLETIIEAWKDNDFTAYKLIVAGGTAEKGDSYSRAIREELLSLNPQPELPGFVDDIDKFLLGLSVLLLPYWPELPSGTSAMALRAAELGVPIIASDTPALKEQLGDGPTYIESKSSQSLAQAIESLNGNWDKIQANALQLSERINKEHSWKSVGEQLVKIVEKAR